MKRTGGLLALLVVLALTLASLTPTAAQQQPQPRRGGTLRIAHIGEPPTLGGLPR